MDLVIKLRMINDAFAENPTAEVARILRSLAADIEQAELEAGMGWVLQDVNGNSTGVVTVTE